ncbi:uncharacterized protein isoform X2 [Danio rerio]
MCDRSVSWSGWYRLLINGLNAEIPDTCVEKFSCGTHAPLWIRGGHPTVEDGVVTRDVCGHWDNYCCYYGSFPIRVKACPGNYYVYELLKPTTCNLAYCAVVTNITNSSTTAAPQTSSSAVTNITNTTTVAPQTTLPAVTDITNTTTTAAPHTTLPAIINIANTTTAAPQTILPAIININNTTTEAPQTTLRAVTDITNTTTTIAPQTSLPAPQTTLPAITNITNTTTTAAPQTTLPAVTNITNTTTAAPETTLSGVTNITNTTTVAPQTSLPAITNITNTTTTAAPQTTLPAVTNITNTTTAAPETTLSGVTNITNTTTVAPQTSLPAITNITNTTTTAAPQTTLPAVTNITNTTTAAPETTLSGVTNITNTTTVAPQTSLPAITNITNTTTTAAPQTTLPGVTNITNTTTVAPQTSLPAITNITNTASTAAPQTSLPAITNITNTASTAAPQTSLPAITNIANTSSTVAPQTSLPAITNIANTSSTVAPQTNLPAVTNITSSSTTVTPQTSLPASTPPKGCTSSRGCLENLLEQIENITAQELPLNIVTNILTKALNISDKISVSSSAVNSAELASYGDKVLKSSEKLISTLVKPTNSSANVSFTLEAVEGQIFMVGPQVTLDKIPQLKTRSCSMDIDLIGIAKNNNDRSAAVAFMSYTTMENLLKADFFNTPKNTIKTMMSTVISATLPKTSNTALTKPVNFTFRHIREFDPNGSLSCVYWNISEWIVDGCSVLNSNSSHTVCSCVHLSTFALIMQTSSSPPPSDLLELLGLVCVIVGLVFFGLALLSFALCQWSPGVNNVARINICISLLSAHLLLLLTQQFLSLIRPQQVLCVVIAGVLHFLFLSAFVWMFIEAVLLFICVKNLSQISSKKKEVLSSGFLCVIGYVVALVVVGVSILLVPEGYGSEHCWIKYDKGFNWSLLGPVCVIIALNMIFFIRISIGLNSALTKLNAEISQLKQTKVMVFKTLGQFVVLGCPWILGFFTNSSEVLEIVFLILNSQQGTFIFLIYCLLNNEIRQQYWKCFLSLCSGFKQH